MESGSIIHEKKLAADAASDEGSVNEQSLALAWNIPRSAISTIRKSRLREHWHWKYGPSKNHGDIRLTKEGVEELKKWVVPPDKPLKVEAPPEVRMSEGCARGVFGAYNPPRPRDVLAPGEPIPDSEDIAVVYRVPPNPRLLLCKDHRGENVSIRINSNLKFRAGMKISLSTQCVRLVPASHEPDRGRVYAFKGKLPRGYGRW